MNIPLARLASVPLLLILAASAAAQTGSGSPPPIRMGLWESEVNVTMSGMPMGDTSTVHASIHHSCMTSDSWKKSLENLHGSQTVPNCTTANMQQDAHKLSFDEDCSSEQGINTSVHVEMLLDSEEEMHGTVAMKMSGPAFPQGMSANSTIHSKFVSADCGSVKPGEQKDVNP